VEEKGISSTVVLFPLLFCVVLLTVLLVPSARSNPIPVNTNLLWLQSENITIDVSPNNNGYTAEVRGVYPFQLSGHGINNLFENLREEALGEMAMMFPVPPNSENISVKIFGGNIEWEWADNEYATELGNFPMLKWTFRIPENMITTTEWGVISDYFTLVVEYAHPIPLENGRYFLLYALGTGRYMGTYNVVPWKTVSAYIETKLPKEVEIIGVKPEPEIDENNNIVITTCEVGGLDTGDYVVEFTQAPVPPASSGDVSPMVYVGIAVVIVVIIGIAAALYMRRRRPTEFRW